MHPASNNHNLIRLLLLKLHLLYVKVIIIWVIYMISIMTICMEEGISSFYSHTNAVGKLGDKVTTSSAVYYRKHTMSYYTSI